MCSFFKHSSTRRIKHETAFLHYTLNLIPAKLLLINPKHAAMAKLREQPGRHSGMYVRKQRSLPYVPSLAMEAGSMSLLKTAVSYSHFQQGSLLSIVHCIIMLHADMFQTGFCSQKNSLTYKFVLRKYLLQVAYTF